MASASWRIYYLRIVRKVYQDTRDPAVLEYAKAVFDRPPLLGSKDATHDPAPPASRAPRVAGRLRSWLSARRPN
jgi:hypothetical protein